MGSKPIQIDEELHKKLKEYSVKTGIKIKKLTEAAIINYLNKIKIDEGNNNGR